MQSEVPPRPEFDLDFPSLVNGFSLAPVEMVLRVVFPFGFKFLGFEGFPCPPECSAYEFLNDHACIVLSHSIPHVTPFFMHVLQYFSPPFARKMAPHSGQILLILPPSLFLLFHFRIPCDLQRIPPAREGIHDVYQGISLFRRRPFSPFLGLDGLIMDFRLLKVPRSDVSYLLLSFPYCDVGFFCIVGGKFLGVSFFSLVFDDVIGAQFGVPPCISKFLLFQDFVHKNVMVDSFPLVFRGVDVAKFLSGFLVASPESLDVVREMTDGLIVVFGFFGIGQGDVLVSLFEVGEDQFLQTPHRSSRIHFRHGFRGLVEIFDTSLLPSQTAGEILLFYPSSGVGENSFSIWHRSSK